MAETMAVIAAVLFMVAGLSASLAAALWFLWGIPAVVRDLAGKRPAHRRRRIQGTRRLPERAQGIRRFPGQAQGTRSPRGQAQGERVPAEIRMVEEILWIHTEEEL